MTVSQSPVENDKILGGSSVKIDVVGGVFG